LIVTVSNAFSRANGQLSPQAVNDSVLKMSSNSTGGPWMGLQSGV